jgi:hypothetical protein
MDVPIDGQVSFYNFVRSKAEQFLAAGTDICKSATPIRVEGVFEDHHGKVVHDITKIVPENLCQGHGGVKSTPRPVYQGWYVRKDANVKKSGQKWPRGPQTRLSP